MYTMHVFQGLELELGGHHRIRFQNENGFGDSGLDKTKQRRKMKHTLIQHSILCSDRILTEFC